MRGGIEGYPRTQDGVCVSVPGEHTRSRNQEREVLWTNQSDCD